MAVGLHGSSIFNVLSKLHTNLHNDILGFFGGGGRVHSIQNFLN